MQHHRVYYASKAYVDRDRKTSNPLQINNSINHSINQSINQSANQPVNQSINQYSASKTYQIWSLVLRSSGKLSSVYYYLFTDVLV
jgi:hypothetical protein